MNNAKQGEPISPAEAEKLEKSALFPFRKEYYYVAMWYAYPGRKLSQRFKPPHRVDFLGGIFRENENKPWQIRYRFRHYATEAVVWPDQDTRSVFRLEAEADVKEETLIPGMQQLCLVFAAYNHSRFVRIDIHGDGERAIALMKDLPFMNMMEQRVIKEDKA